MTDAERLLPCPFCGSSAYVEENDLFDEGSWRYLVSCGSLDCFENITVESKGETRAEAIAAWNRRASIESKEPTRAAELPEDVVPFLCDKGMVVWQNDYDRLRSLCERQQERIRGLEKDAERYRWLRSQDVNTNPVYYPFWESFGAKLCREERLDSTIDAAIQAASRPQDGEGK